MSLPLSATNRARVDNQVYIGMFRPSLGKKPRWFGNLKRYQLALFNDVPRLADVKLHSAINPIDDNVRDLRREFLDRGYRELLGDSGYRPARCESNCLDADVTTSPWSDLPDGPLCGKRRGGAADAPGMRRCRRRQNNLHGAE